MISVLIRSIAQKLTHHDMTLNQVQNCLKEIQSYVESVVDNPFYNGLLINLPELDNFCTVLGSRLFKLYGLSEKHVEHSSSQQINLYIVSQLYLTGGHTMVLEDFVKIHPNKKHVIIFSGLFESINIADVQQRFSFKNVEIIFPPRQKHIAEKVIWLAKEWIKLHPHQVYLFNHHHDVIAVSVVQPDMPGEVYYYHHADYILGLGKNLPHIQHIDMNPLMYTYCRHEMKIENIYFPLTCEDLNLDAALPQRFKKRDVINTASSGAAAKFLQPYAYHYFEILPDILNITQGTHTHIGYLPRFVLKRIRKKLISQGISQERFQYIPWVKNVGKTLLEREIDLYLTSFPVGGGRTAIEVMASGTPMLCHLNYRSVFLSEISFLYPSVMTWKTPQQLCETLSMLSMETLECHAKLARKHYEEFYTPQLLKEAFQHTLKPCNEESLCKILETKTTDASQLFLDLTQEWKRPKNHLKKILRFILQKIKPKK